MRFDLPAHRFFMSLLFVRKNITVFLFPLWSGTNVPFEEVGLECRVVPEQRGG
jgi:hypothetical protein